MTYRIVAGPSFRRFDEAFNGRLLHILITVDFMNETLAVIGVTDEWPFFQKSLYATTEFWADATAIDIFGAAQWLCSIPVTVNA